MTKVLVFLVATGVLSQIICLTDALSSKASATATTSATGSAAASASSTATASATGSAVSSATASASSTSSQPCKLPPVSPCPPKCSKANEILEYCPPKCPFRTCGIDDTLIDCVPSPTPGDPNCPPPACRCKPQFFRDDKGNCVPWKKCPKCKNPNEVYDPCDASCPGRSCSVDPATVRCKPPPQLGDKDCVAGCRCIDGYAKNSNGVCIPREQCPPKQPTCGLNEVYDPCPDCSPQTCETMNNTYHCPLIPACKTGPNCKPSCRCKPGFFRNLKGECIAGSDCAKCTKPHEYYSCGGACDNVCETLSKQNQTSCPIINIKCNEMCYCEKDYARDCNGDCIPIKDCPAPRCQNPNEVYDPCDAPCPGRTCSVDPAVVLCLAPAPEVGDKECVVGCRCIDGYAKDNNGVCVPREECPKCTKPHEIFKCGSACDNVCDTIREQNQTNCPIINVQCNDMCYCENDYARDYKGDCIPIKDCPICPPNERYDPCPASLCAPQTCEQAGFPIACPQVVDGTCAGGPGCVCRDGFLRDENNVCVPANQCPSCGGDKNATLGCGVNCNRKCSNLDDSEPQFCIDICYPNSCDCKTDENGIEYYYDDTTKQCVLPQDCTPQCNDNEIFSTCVNSGCGAQECADINKPVECFYPGPDECKPGCKCAPGFLKSSNGTCVPSEQCDPPPKCDVNEEFSKCGRDGCLNYYCSDLDLPPLCRDTFQCIPQCECKEGFLRASFDNRTCVPVENCPRQCKTNEIYSDCPSASCQPQTCKELGFPIPCPIVGPDGQCSGEPGCVCSPGYLKDDNGVCIPQEQCPSCGGDPNAGPGCSNYCGNSCDSYNSTEISICPLFCILNGCACKTGFVYNNDLKKCVLPEQCIKCKNPNEVYDPCDASCPGRSCSVDPTTVKCTPPPQVGDKDCVAGCRCIDGYAKNSDGVCIPREQCPPKQPTCGTNEVYDPCPDCSSQTCETRNNTYHCPLIPASKTGPNCKPSCRCKPGFFRNLNGECISGSDCAKCTKPHEYYSCGGACDNVCETLSEQNQTSCPIINIKCNEKCYCEKDYARDCNGNCIPIKDCPAPSPRCQNPNEVYDPCDAPCPGRTCSVDPALVLCLAPAPKVGDKECVVGCRCIDGYAKDNNGVCVPREECPPTCQVNEEFTTCIEGVCRNQNCAEKGTSYPTCPVVSKGDCTAGCVCQKGYLKSANGTCVPEDQCKTGEACPGGATLNTCPPAPCDAEYCPRSRSDPQSCISTKNCDTPRCTCGFNRLRDRKTGNCIAASSCPPFPCDGPNESYNSCPPVCPGETCLDFLNNSTCPKYKIGIVVPCKPACRCNEGFYRNGQGICVASKKCKDSACKKNEEYTTCEENINRAQTCDDRNKPLPTPVAKTCCTAGCVCKKNYLKDDSGNCIPADQCDDNNCN